MGDNVVSMLANVGAEAVIRDTWKSNLEQEFVRIRNVVEDYNYVAMDTEFPGFVARPAGEFKNTLEYNYQCMRCNVDLLKIIQLGLTFYNEKGEQPPGGSTWQFNFKFNLEEDMYSEESIALLMDSGIKFKQHQEDGIEVQRFAELLTTSGVVLSSKIYWLSFHSGYDFGYLLKLLTASKLPTEEAEFFDLLQIFFPHIYDVKYLMRSCKNLKGGLQEISDSLEIIRIGQQHQAGSDSLLTGATFFKMRQRYFDDKIDEEKFCGHLFGLSHSYHNGKDTVPGVGHPALKDRDQEATR